MQRARGDTVPLMPPAATPDRPTTRRYRRRHRRAVTAVELLIVYIVLAGVIWVLVGISRHVRDSAKQRQAVQLMSALTDAMTIYQFHEKAYPPVLRDGDATECLRLLAANPKSRKLLQDKLPDRWRAQLDEDEPWLDPWGTPLRYVDGSEAAPARGEQRMPYLELAGKDRDFGGPSRDALVRSTDNLRTDEPMPYETSKNRNLETSKKGGASSRD